MRHALIASVVLLAATPTPPPPSALGVPFTYVRASEYTRGIYSLFDNYNAIANPQASPKRRLFVWLPATDGTPGDYLYIQAVAALAGYNVIGLEYPNGPYSVSTLCLTSADPNCWADVRYEIMTGAHTSSLVTVDPTNSILGRLVHLLHYLAKKYPSGGWARFLQGDRPNWSLIELGGHSQGAGHAPFIAKYYAVRGVCSIEGPPDGNAFVPVAPWLYRSGATPAKAEYGFANSLDTHVPFTTILNSWSALGFDGLPSDPLVSVDHPHASYRGSHALYTSMASEFPLVSHNLTAADANTPIGSDGVPIFAPVWRYICGFGR